MNAPIRLLLLNLVLLVLRFALKETELIKLFNYFGVVYNN